MELIEYKTIFRQQVDAYYLKNLTFTGSPKKAVKTAETNKNYHPVLAFEGKELVTFFALDYSKDKFKYTQNEQSFLLRSFSTDSRYVHHGYAKTALMLMPNFIQKHYPGVNEIILGVNEKNKPAIQLYKNTGFADTGRRYIGSIGPQIIMYMNIC